MLFYQSVKTVVANRKAGDFAFSSEAFAQPLLTGFADADAFFIIRSSVLHLLLSVVGSVGRDNRKP